MTFMSVTILQVTRPGVVDSMMIYSDCCIWSQDPEIYRS